MSVCLRLTLFTTDLDLNTIYLVSRVLSKREVIIVEGICVGGVSNEKFLRVHFILI